MCRSIVLSILVLTTAIGVGLVAAPAAYGDSLESEIAPVLEEYCIRCHGAEKAEGKLRLDLLTSDFAQRDNSAAWIEVRNMINLGEMPPADEKQPPVELIERTSRWIAAGLRATERAQLSTGGRVLLRRMNRHEYTNTIADLLSMKFPAGESPLDALPPDGTAEGFDKVSAALLLDPSLMRQYYRVARRVADRAIVDGPPEYPTEKMRMEFEDIAQSNAIGYLVTRLGMKPIPGGLQLVEGSTRSFGMLRYPGRRDNNVAPVNGFYRFTVRAGGARGTDGQVPRMLLNHSHPDDSMRSIMEVDVTAPWDKPAEYSVTVSRDALGGELNVRMVNETSLYMGQRPGENFMRRNGELGEQGNFTETLLALLNASQVLADGATPADDNTIGMKFMRIPAGEFVRGFDSSDGRERRFQLAHQYSNSQEFKNETPSHRVAISRSFDIGVTEVTVGQFRTFVKATGYVTEAERNGGALGCFPDEKNYVDRFHKAMEITWKSPGFEQDETHPAVAVSWNDAQAFCQWLSRTETSSYRLPGEAEWEYACRAGKPTWYSWGEDPDAAYRHANVADGALEAAQPGTTRFQRAIGLGADEGDGVVYTARVASYQPNPWGLYDLHGNVWEWCQDRWAADLYERYFDGVPRQDRPNVIIRDPLFEDRTDRHQYGDWRVLRGGGWTCAPAAVRCSIRTFAEAADAAVYTGFRVVRELP